MKKYAFLVLFCILFSGCISTRQTAGVAKMSKTVIEQITAIELDEAYCSQSELYLKYSVFFKDIDSERVFYGYVNWRPQNDSDVDLSKEMVVPADFITKEKWQNRPLDLKEVAGLDYHISQNIVSKIIYDLTPKETKTGQVLRVGEEELFLYYDERGQIEIVDVKDKPADYKIKESVSHKGLSDVIADSLDQYLPEGRKQTPYVMLTLFPWTERSEPFIFVDLQNRFAVSLKIVASDEKHYTGSPITKSIKSADNLILKSHVFGLAVRPFSSAFRLFAWSKSTAVDVIDPKKFEMIGSGAVPPLTDRKPMNLDEWEEELNRILGKKAAEGKIDKFLIGGDEFFPILIDSFLKAEKSIDVRIFIFDNDDYGVKIADILKKRSNEGIKVRVLLDGMGSVMGEEAIPDNLPAGFVPPYSMETYISQESKIEIRMRPNAWFKADHIKTIIIDDKICYTGGMNIGREYRYNWHDMMMEVTGPVVAEIQREFDLAWAHADRMGDLSYFIKKIAARRPKKYGSGYPVRLLYTWANDPQIFKAQVEAIKRAKKYIYINNAYFSDNTIIRELLKARQRGVDVRVILPVNGNHEIMNKNNLVVANLMFKHGIRVYFYPGMSHIKAAIYDGWLCTGTANFDKLSLKDNLELNLATSDPQTVNKLLTKLFNPDFEKSMEMTEIIKTGLQERIAKFLATQL